MPDVSEARGGQASDLAAFILVSIIFPFVIPEQGLILELAFDLGFRGFLESPMILGGWKIDLFPFKQILYC